MNAELVGRASMALGAGRSRVDDVIDHGAGIVIGRRRGEAVRAGEAVFELHYNDDRGLAEATALASSAIEIADAPPAFRPLILGVVR